MMMLCTLFDQMINSNGSAASVSAAFGTAITAGALIRVYCDGRAPGSTSYLLAELLISDGKGETYRCTTVVGFAAQIFMTRARYSVMRAFSDTAMRSFVVRTARSFSHRTGRSRALSPKTFTFPFEISLRSPGRSPVRPAGWPFHRS